MIDPTEPDYAELKRQLTERAANVAALYETGIVAYDLQAPTQLLVPMTGPHPCRVCGQAVEGYAPLRDRAAIEKHAPCREQEETWRAMVRATFANEDVVQAQLLADKYADAARRVLDAKIRELDVPDWVKESELAIAEEDDSE